MNRRLSSLHGTVRTNYPAARWLSVNLLGHRGRHTRRQRRQEGDNRRDFTWDKQVVMETNSSPADLRLHAKLNANGSKDVCVCVCVLVSAFIAIHVQTCLFSQRKNSPHSSHHGVAMATGSLTVSLKWCLRFWHSFQVCHQSTCLCVFTCCCSHPSLSEEETTKAQQGDRAQTTLSYLKTYKQPALSNQVIIIYDSQVYDFNQISTVYDFNQNILNINQPSRQENNNNLTYDVTDRAYFNPWVAFKYKG